MPSYRARPSRPDRAKAIAAVLAVHAAMGALLMMQPNRAAEPIKQTPTILVDIEPPIPPAPPPPTPRADRAPDEEGAAGKKADPTEIVAPPARLPAPSPVAAAPIAGQGSSPSAGSANAGSGTGAGGSGSGRGGGGGGSGAQYLSGGLMNADYPRTALREGATGTVGVRFTVLTSGRIANCRVVRSSGSGTLDDTTCRLLTQRLRFRPATDGAGRPIASELGSDYTWGIRQRY